ncbi:MAG: outer membrane lipoprotein carrier protein LolA [Bacteroidales bacterium]|nr:outer membrane lipoprotein carrier protein LolA [Bacteroidales bacterium]
MKKIAMMAALLIVMPLGLLAQDVILDRIESMNASIKTIEAHFDQTKTLPASGKEIKSEGTLYFTAKDRMSMVYSSPESDLFIIDGTKVSMSHGGRKNVYDTSRNALMGSLSATLLGCITGQVRPLAMENDAEIAAEQTKDGYLVTMTARKKAAKGYSSIVLLYDLKTCVLKRMEMVEFSKISNLYEMSSIKTGGAIPPAVYVFDGK